jgi:predicted DNA-binding protein
MTTKPTSIWLDPDLRERVKAKAAANGETMSDVVRRAFERYAGGDEVAADDAAALRREVAILVDALVNPAGVMRCRVDDVDTRFAAFARGVLSHRLPNGEQL